MASAEMTAAPDVVVLVLGETGTIASCTAGVERLLGFSSEELVGRTLSSLYDPKDRFARAPLDTVRLGGTEPRRFRRKDGSVVDAWLTLAPNGAESVAVIVLDTRAAVVERERDFWVAALAHDLRQPIHVIRMAAAAAQPLAPPAPVRGLFQRIGVAAERLSQMAVDLLQVGSARLGGEAVLRREDVDLVELARELVRDVSLTHAGHDLSLDAVEPLTGAWDRGKLDRILQNLVDNAVEHSPPGSSVRISCRRTDGDGAVLSVSNPSPELSPQALGRLFEPFFRSDKRGHVGLGLHVARELARAHGGDVTTWWHDDTITFTLFLPLEPPDRVALNLRRHTRLPLDHAFEIGVGDRVLEVQGRDVSRGGVAFYTDVPIAVRERIRIDIFADEALLSLLGTVRHVKAADGGRSLVGVEFPLELSEHEVELLRRPSVAS